MVFLTRVAATLHLGLEAPLTPRGISREDHCRAEFQSYICVWTCHCGRLVVVSPKLSSPLFLERTSPYHRQVLTNVMNWMFVSPYNSEVGIQTPKVMTIGGGAFVRWLDHEGEALMNGIGVLIKGTPESLTLFPHVKTELEVSRLQSGRQPSPELDPAGPWSQTSSLQNSEK